MRALIALQVLFLVLNAWAVEVTVSYSVSDMNLVTLSYVANGDANVPRAFGLDIQLTTDAVISDVTMLSSDYWVTPGAYPGTDPVGDPCDSADTLPGPDSNGITIEMGSLHSPPGYDSPNAPAMAGDLVSFRVSGDCDITFSENEARGGVVKYDATRAITNLPFSTEFPPYNGPDCWLWPYQCYGDSALNDGLVNVQDFLLFRASYNKSYPDPAYNPCCDANRDGHVNVQDFLGFRPVYNTDVSDKTPCTPGGV